ncbi:hypothetical protein [Ruminococcus sp.]|uniref:hypothetical protein n=1 Tax=Ruminococcus sp. TaxID=41978 RepID=UPI0025DA0775|nr:hypothetical protein [Ruminococcus sp.]MCR4639497.1 hypothetical protein [Ruminococcus sp.]
MRIKSKIIISKMTGCMAVFLTFFLTGVIFLYNDSHLFFLLRLGVMFLGAVCGYYICLNKKKCRNIFIISLAFVCSWICCFVTQNVPNSSPVDLIYTLFYIGISIVMLFNIRHLKICSLIMSLIVMLYILYKLFIGVHFTNILTATSQNYISVLILFFLLLYYSSCYEANDTFFVFPSYLFFVCCLMAQGRSGIVLSAIFSIVITFFKIKNIENKLFRKFLKVIIVVLLVFMVFYLFSTIKRLKGDLNGTYLARFTNKGTVDSARIVIWKDYFANNFASLNNFLFSSETVLIRDDGNLHNSFFMCYAGYGFFMFVFMMSLIIYAVFCGIKKKNYFMVFLFITLLLRALTDKIFFQGYCEVFLYYYIFYFIINRSNRIKKGKNDANNRILLYLYNSISNNNSNCDGV